MVDLDPGIRQRSRIFLAVGALLFLANGTHSRSLSQCGVDGFVVARTTSLDFRHAAPAIGAEVAGVPARSRPPYVMAGYIQPEGSSPGGIP